MILFVGDKPSAKMKPGARSFEGAACEKRLMEWINYLSPNSIIGRDYVVFNSYKMPDEDYGWLVLATVSKYPIITFGNSAHKRLKKLGYESFKLPHPSGRSRQINDKEFIAKKLAECKEWLGNA